MARYFDIDKLAKMARTKANTLITGKQAFDYVAKWLDLLPTADVEEVKHGEWIEDFKPIDTVGMGSGKRSYLVGYKCSLCGRSEIKKEPYCNCGAKMDGGKAG